MIDPSSEGGPVEALAAERVTLRGIARLLGVSHATVSLALRGSPRISVARRSEVLQVAERLGYRPDPMLSALRHYRRTVGRPSIQAEIAWLNFWPQPGRLRSFREFDGYWRGALAMAEAQGYRLEEFRVNSQLSIDRLRAILRARNIKGLLLPPVPATCHLSMDTLAWAEHSVVCFGHSHSGLRGMPVVTVDQAAAAALAFRKIRERGYHRVGLVTSLETVRRTRFAAGYLQSQLFVPEAERLPLLALSEENSEPTPVVEWFRRHQPDAILTDVACLAGQLESAGLRVPTDVGLVALSVLDGGVGAGIDQNAVEVGRIAAEALIAQLQCFIPATPDSCRQIFVEPRWVDGASLPRIQTSGDAR